MMQSNGKAQFKPQGHNISACHHHVTLYLDSVAYRKTQLYAQSTDTGCASKPVSRLPLGNRGIIWELLSRQ